VFIQSNQPTIHEEVTMLIKSPDTRFVDEILVKNVDTNLKQLTDRELPWKEFRNTNRLVMSMGRDYPYSGQVAKDVGWDTYPKLYRFMQRCNEVLGTNYNAALLNWYIAGTYTGIGAHSDAEAELVPNSTVLSLSLGASCIFNFHEIVKGEPYPPKTIEKSVELQSGDLFLMGRECQKHYMHSIARTKMLSDRISVTFRQFRN
jgi:alkylated DNA repair dioxygenase AlkB